MLKSIEREHGESYLTGANELQGPEGRLQVLGVVLQVIEGVGERGLQLGGVLPRRGVGGDLVESSHDCRRARSGCAAGAASCR